LSDFPSFQFELNDIFNSIKFLMQSPQSFFAEMLYIFKFAKGITEER